MKDKPLISVVLPTYNVAQYLQQCLESVAAQTYRNIEVIIVIDGSTDGSYEIAQEFCKTDSRFSVYWQENAGSGPARNAGLAHCKGELVMFVDPDDWIEPKLLEKLYEAQSEGDYDLVASRRIFVTCQKNGKITHVNKLHYKDEAIINQQDLRKAFMRMIELSVVSAPTQKLYKSTIIRKYDISFPPFRRSQDVAFNYSYYNHISSLRLIAYSGYNYRLILQNDGKTPLNYREVINRLYKVCQSMYAEWNIPFPEQEMCNFFFRARIYSHLQNATIHNWSIPEFIKDPIIWHITEIARPDKWYLKVAQKLILSHSDTTLRVFLRFIQFIKIRVLKVTRLKKPLK